MFGRPGQRQSIGSEQTAVADPEKASTGSKGAFDTTDLKRATRTRKAFSLLTSFQLLISVVFLILVEAGNTAVGSRVLNNIYFISLNLSDIIPSSVPDAEIINTIAQTLGLHDFYQVGLWNYCEGYTDGVTGCSSPQALYWFDPVAIILSELLAGASIQLPAEVTTILGTIKLASHWMFGLFLAGTCMAFVMIFVAPLSVYSRWIALVTAVFTGLAALFITAASIVATVMFVIMRNAFTSVTELNIGATIGREMFAFMWIASASAIVAFVIQLAECCCCASRRDVKTGRKEGRR